VTARNEIFQRRNIETRLNVSRQHTPAIERRIRRRREFRRPAGQLFQRVGIHHNPAPAALYPFERLSHCRRGFPQWNRIVGLARDVETGVAFD
jgi:hypothetical protein